MAKHSVYRFYSELRGVEPKIWRRFEINGEKTMAELAYALMIMYEMLSGQAFFFYENFHDVFYGSLMESLPEDAVANLMEIPELAEATRDRHYELVTKETSVDNGEQLIEADCYRLMDITNVPGWQLRFEYDFQYDFTDSWKVDLTLEECGRVEVSLSGLPCVIEGEGLGIVEDAGGAVGLMELAEAFKEGAGEKYEGAVRWLGESELDLASFDIADMNFRLKKLLRVYRDMYESDKKPSDASESFIEREYLKKGSAGL